ncbi:MAG: N-acetylmuramoyl-L-alanine amidase [Bacteroidaceae bacterium]|nr:N-acetylmuramoyl-L-alanine amidase [Bacteroidaceae bacterium]MBR4930455.1 N-acetylmuramoyl-L-alanine amidase [Bacteroidaceae bacterium]
MRLYKQILKENDCFKDGKKIVPKGVMVHSTGANNPNLRRYVAPNDGIIGEPSMSHWNQPGRNACVHAFIGKTADGSIATYQTLPWDMRGWHCGGYANNTHISFEICEDNLKNEAYFSAVYQEAVELTAHLCRMFDLDPLAPGVVITHAEGNQMGWASNHGDVLHWFPKHGKTMDDFRRDVSRIMEEDTMTEARIREIIRDELQKIETERADLSASPWAVGLLATAKAKGITDGSRPQSYATRQEVAIMVNAVK